MFNMYVHECVFTVSDTATALDLILHASRTLPAFMNKWGTRIFLRCPAN